MSDRRTAMPACDALVVWPRPQRIKWTIYFTVPVVFGYGLARSPAFLEFLKDLVRSGQGSAQSRPHSH